MMKLTIVICTHNRAELVLKTLESLDNAIVPENVDITVLVIPNACSDNTITTLQAYQAQRTAAALPIDVVEEPTAGKSYALNKALGLVKHGWISFVDDDQRVEEQFFLASIAAIASYPDTRLFCGRVFADWTGAEPAWVHDKGDYQIRPLPLPEFDLGDEDQTLAADGFIPGGGNLLIDCQVFEKVGQYSVLLGPTGHNFVGSEDADLILRALSAGETLCYVPKIIQYHYVDLWRFELKPLMMMNYQRNRSITKVQAANSRKVPHYLWLKLATYLANAAFSLSLNKTRFYLYKSAAIAGQIMGILQSSPSV